MRGLARLAYRVIGRLGVLDITRLTMASTTDLRRNHRCESADDVTTAWIDPKQLDELRDANLIDTIVGAYPVEFDIECATPSMPFDPCMRALSTIDVRSRRQLVGRFKGHRVVSFLWLAYHHVPASDNYSRASHLGSSLTLPTDTAFVYNAWTDANERGRGHLGHLLHFVATHPAPGDDHAAKLLLATSDWTNESSLRAFHKSQFKGAGVIIRAGRGPWQWTRVPDIEPLWRSAAKQDFGESTQCGSCLRNPCIALMPRIAIDGVGWRWPR
ncbi:MAG: hypothetical protein AAF539_15900 [Planctomycetota bacterium]